MSLSDLMAADLAYALGDCGVVVTLGAASTVGIVDRVGLEVAADSEGRELSSRAVTVTIPTGSLAGLEPGAQIAWLGANWYVRECLEIEDGAQTRIECVKEK